jgi:glyoxylase-like metal-dependent hydrolase (beta-lactamase superfamily II)
MRRVLLIGFLLAVGAAGIVAQQPAGGPPQVAELVKVRDNLYVVKGGGGNTAAFVTGAGVVLVDTKLANWGERIMQQVRSVTDKPVTMIINTHSHPDHLGSNTEIDTARGSVQVVVQANTAKRMATMPSNNKVSQSFEDRLTLGSGGDQIDLYWFGPAHTDGDAFVVFPRERVLAMGDAMAWDMGPLIDPMSGGSMVGAADTIGKLVAGVSGIDKVVEGHGHVNTWAGLQRYLAYTQKVVEVAKKGNAEGLNYVEAFDKYFAPDPAMAPYIDENLKPGLEYGGTPKSRSLNNIFIAMMELRGEKPPLIMGAPPPPGQPLPAGPGGGGPRPGGQAPFDDGHGHL